MLKYAFESDFSYKNLYTELTQLHCHSYGATQVTITVILTDYNKSSVIKFAEKYTVSFCKYAIKIRDYLKNYWEYTLYLKCCQLDINIVKVLN